MVQQLYQRLLLTLVLLVAATHLEAQEIDRTYILPILKWGPNNQKRDLRQLAAAAKLMDTGLVLTGMFKHYSDVGQAERKAGAAVLRHSRHVHAGGRHVQAYGWRQRLTDAILWWRSSPLNNDNSNNNNNNNNSSSSSSVSSVNDNKNNSKACFKTRYYGFLNFEEVFDRAPFDSWVPTLTLAELRAKGWNGTIEALIHSNGFHETFTQTSYQRTLEGIGATLAPGAPVIKVPTPMKCDMATLQSIKTQIQQFKVVAALVWVLDVHYVPPMEGMTPQKLPAGKCPRTSMQAEWLVKPAPWIQQIASKFAQRHFKGHDFLAVHVRPFPDNCLDVWKGKELNATELSKVCDGKLKTLHKDLVPKVKQAMAKTGNTKKLFIMAHPKIRHNIQKLFAKSKSKLSITWLREAELTELAGCTDHSSSFMSLVEEAISASAKAFLGTHASSISRSIMLMRQPGATTTYFES